MDIGLAFRQLAEAHRLATEIFLRLARGETTMSPELYQQLAEDFEHGAWCLRQLARVCGADDTETPPDRVM